MHLLRLNAANRNGLTASTKSIAYSGDRSSCRHWSPKYQLWWTPSTLRPIARYADAVSLCWRHRTLSTAWLSTDGRAWLQDRDGKRQTLVLSLQPMHAAPQRTARWQSRQRQALAKNRTSANASVPKKTNTVTSKNRPCVDSLESDDDDFEWMTIFV